MLRRLREAGANPAPAAALTALRALYLGTLGSLLLPGLLVLLGLWLFGTAVPAWNAATLLALGGVALACAALSLGLAERAYRRGRSYRAAMQAAIQSAPAPAVPFLLGCASPHDPAALLSLWGLALLLGLLGWWWLGRWKGPYGP